MKHPLKTISLLTASALFSLSSLTAVETDPVGYVTSTLAAGSHLLSAPLNKVIIHTGTVGGVNGAEVSLSNLPETVTSPLFLHVLSGTASGKFESLTSTTTSSVTLEQTISGLAEGDQIRIVEHFTLADVTSASSDGIGNGSIITMYSASGQKSDFTHFAGDWYNSLGEVVNDAILFPGEGIVISLNEETTFTFAGGVNTSPVNFELNDSAFSLFSMINPSDQTEDGTVSEVLNGLGNNSKITVYSEDGNLNIVETYTLFGGDWYDGSGQIVSLSIPSPSTVVVNSSSVSEVSIPAAYTNQIN